MSPKTFKNSTLLGNSSFSLKAGDSTWHLPNMLAALWVAHGFSFQPNFDLYTRSGLIRYLGWFLLGYDELVKNFHHLEHVFDHNEMVDFLLKSILPESEENRLYLPVFFYCLYLTREDLKNKFNLTSVEGLILYLLWIRDWGYSTLPKSHLIETAVEKLPLEAFVENNQFLTALREFDLSLCFDGTKYIKAYPDVIEAIEAGVFASAYQHWIQCGIEEDRKAFWSDKFDLPSSFNEAEYFNTYPDVAEIVRAGLMVSGHQHWVRHGKEEGRTAFWSNKFKLPLCFNETEYLNANLDVMEAIKAGQVTSGYQHWLSCGRAEGRMAFWSFNWERLRNSGELQDSELVKVYNYKQEVEQLLSNYLTAEV
ncbi:hypothetical protein [Pseudanabaena sp. FACHB-2040]|uniref:hypothetical protein n=1 Tax=Pseudanabaena sp. FACHB-2040 TaxID=2692859 RepID=UPI001683F89E|nr:hypothetical protein [Pseudanabaena sp. FACHB-2040]MBD2257275.1 hypothetical protein [Pseudanabaena sp. FACHB-2040]